MEVEDVAREVFRELQEARLGTVVAVWRDGGVSAHRHLGFRHRRLPDGSREQPLTSFVKDLRVFSVADIRARIERALAAPQRG